MDVDGLFTLTDCFRRSYLLLRRSCRPGSHHRACEVMGFRDAGHFLWPAPKEAKLSRVFPLGTPFVFMHQRRQKISTSEDFLLCCYHYHFPTCSKNHRSKWGFTVGSYVALKRDIVFFAVAILSSYASRGFEN